jgi:uncharacterized protein (DUF1800 family)
VLQQDAPEPIALVRTAHQQGQNLFDPPNVKGRAGGNAWITSSTLLARQQFLERTLRAMDLNRPDQDYLGRLLPLLAATAPVQTPAAHLDRAGVARAAA